MSRVDPGDVDLSRCGASAAVPKIGVDGKGASHYYDDSHDRVIVIAASGDVEHVQRLEATTVGDWIEFVADRRGWTHGGDEGYQLADLLASAVD